MKKYAEIIIFALIFLILASGYFITSAELLCSSWQALCVQKTEMQYLIVIVICFSLPIFAKKYFRLPKLFYLFVLTITFSLLVLINNEVKAGRQIPVLLHDLADDVDGATSSILYRDLLLREPVLVKSLGRKRRLIKNTTVLDDRAVGIDVYGDRKNIYLKFNKQKLFLPIKEILPKKNSFKVHSLGLDLSELVLVDRVQLIGLPFQPYEETLSFLQRLLKFEISDLRDKKNSDLAESLLKDWANVYGGWVSSDHRAVPWFELGNFNFKKALAGENLSKSEIACAISAYQQALAYLAKDRRSEFYQAISNNLGLAYFFKFLTDDFNKKKLLSDLKQIGWSQKNFKNSKDAYARVKKLNYLLLTASLRKKV